MKQTMPSIAVATIMLLVGHAGAQTVAPSSFFEGPAECSLNAACGDLEKDCCPTADGVYLSEFLACLNDKRLSMGISDLVCTLFHLDRLLLRRNCYRPSLLRSFGHAFLRSIG